MKKQSRISAIIVAISLFVGLLLPVTASAYHNDAIPTGIRIQITNIDQATRQVDFDVLMSSFSSSTSSKELPSAWIGNRFFYNNYSAYSSFSSEWVLVHPSGIKALDFGDGAVIDATQLAIDVNAPRTYKGSFSHTYAMPGSYTITTKVVGVYLGNTASPDFPVNYGNPIYFTPGASSGNSPNAIGSNGKKGGAGVNTHSSSHSSTAGFFAYRPASGTRGLGRNYSSSQSNNMLGISNTTAVTLDAQGPVIGAGIPIPSLDALSKLLLGLFVALAGGLMLLQRR